MNSCSVLVGVPNNYFSFQDAYSGNAYAGFEPFIDAGNDNYREYLEVMLTENLIKDKYYCVSYYVSIANISGFVIGCLGIYFSNDTLITWDMNHQYIPVIPQVENNPTNFLIDSAGWMRIEGFYHAKGGERFITIGNFRNNINTPSISNGSGSIDSYYYIDDISVEQCELQEPTTATLLNGSSVFSINGLESNTQLILYNALGQRVYKSDNYDNLLSMVNYAGGVYVYYLKLPTGEVYRGKVVVVK